MSAAAQHLGLLDQFRDTPQEAPNSQQATFRLTPHLVLASALLHMMASDGQIEEAESSQLQSVIGGDQNVMNVAVQYAQTVPLTQFLTDAYQVLDKASTLCVLANVCDSLLADGSAGPDELALFERMKTAWGVDTATFAPYQKAIALKNNDSVMGEYDAGRLADQVVTPHLALAASLLYMMAADGSIATEEIGQLQTAIGEFQGLQEAALKQVRSVKLPDFLKRAAPSLSPEVKLYILANVCDSMMADGDVDALENKIFQTMLAGYGHDNASFKPFYQSIKVKNIKTFSAAVHKPKLIYSNMSAGSGQDEKGVRFNRDNSLGAETSGVAGQGDLDSGKGPVIAHVLPGQEGGHVGNRTMQENIDKVSQGFGDEDQVHVVQDNALADQLAKASKAPGADDNIQNIGGKSLSPSQDGPILKASSTHASGPVLNAVPPQGPGPNLLDTNAASANLQSVATDPAMDNAIRLPSQALADNTSGIKKEGIADRNVALEKSTDPSNQAKLSGTGVADNTLKLGTSANDAHLETLPTSGNNNNIQPLTDDSLTVNRQAIPEGATDENRQPLGSTAHVDQAAAIAKTPLNDNRQAAAEKSLDANRQPAASPTEAANRQGAGEKALGTNTQPAPAPTPSANRQPVPQDAVSSTRDNAPIQTVGTHRAKLPGGTAAPQITLKSRSQPTSAGLTLDAQKPMVRKVDRVKQLTEHVSQLRLRLDQLAGLNHAVLEAAEKAAGGNCSTCGNPKCLFTHHVH